MKTLTEKPKKQAMQGRHGGNTRGRGAGTVAFADRRPEAAAHENAQRLADSGPQARGIAQMQSIADLGTPNRTGLPDTLKTGIENLSGYAMDDVRTHYNSDKPAQLNAHAFAQGTDIHIAPGQEKHLPHEAWHVVQQKQGRVRPTVQLQGGVNVNDDAGLEEEADVMGVKALEVKPESGGNNTYQKVSSLNHSIVQTKRRKAVVDWQVTHLVSDHNGSLFGEDTEQGWREGELPVEEGELARGQQVVVDDQQIFMSRRGSNQEDSEKRHADMTSELKHKWYQVLEVDDVNYEGKNVYIRSETMKFLEAEQREHRPTQIVEIPEVAVLGKDISNRLTEIGEAWQVASLKRRRSLRQVKYKGENDHLPEGLSSGWNWDQYDEGQDVAGDMANTHDRRYMQQNQPTNFTISAHYGDDDLKTPIAFLVMEEWEPSTLEDASGYEAPEQRFFYIRWLIGHPELKGGGSAVMTHAKKKAIELQRAIYVQVAYSAVKWYKDTGFNVVEKGEFQEGEGYGDTLLKFIPPA